MAERSPRSRGEARLPILPPLSSRAASRTRWFAWYAPWYEVTSSFSDGTGTSGASCSSHYDRAYDRATFGYPLLVGARWVCTSGGDCELR